MGVGVKLSLNAKYVQKRLKKIPQYYADYIKVMTKKDAYGVVRSFKNGIKNDGLGLQKLNPVTIKRKTDLKQPKPNTPLYGKGGNDKRTYYNMLLVKSIKNGHKIVPSKRKHHSGNITLEFLFNIHEYGCVIAVTEKMRGYLHFIGIHLKKSTTMIRIPARRALFKCYEKYLKGISKRDRSQKVKRMITKYVKDGNYAYIQSTLEKVKSELERDMI